MNILLNFATTFNNCVLALATRKMIVPTWLEKLSGRFLGEMVWRQYMSLSSCIIVAVRVRKMSDGAMES